MIYEFWLEQVNNELLQLQGETTEDYFFLNWVEIYKQGIEPRNAALEAINGSFKDMFLNNQNGDI